MRGSAHQASILAWGQLTRHPPSDPRWYPWGPGPTQEEFCLRGLRAASVRVPSRADHRVWRLRRGGPPQDGGPGRLCWGAPSRRGACGLRPVGVSEAAVVRTGPSRWGRGCRRKAPFPETGGACGRSWKNPGQPGLGGLEDGS